MATVAVGSLSTSIMAVVCMWLSLTTSSIVGLPMAIDTDEPMVIEIDDGTDLADGGVASGEILIGPSRPDPTQFYQLSNNAANTFDTALNKIADNVVAETLAHGEVQAAQRQRLQQELAKADVEERQLEQAFRQRVPSVLTSDAAADDALVAAAMEPLVAVASMDGDNSVDDLVQALVADEVDKQRLMAENAKEKAMISQLANDDMRVRTEAAQQINQAVAGLRQLSSQLLQ